MGRLDELDVTEARTGGAKFATEKPDINAFWLLFTVVRARGSGKAPKEPDIVQAAGDRQQRGIFNARRQLAPAAPRTSRMALDLYWADRARHPTNVLHPQRPHDLDKSLFRKVEDWPYPELSRLANLSHSPGCRSTSARQA
jgi:hypothetical protein